MLIKVELKKRYVRVEKAANGRYGSAAHPEGRTETAFGSVDDAWNADHTRPSEVSSIRA
jgi:hypothetical protein